MSFLAKANATVVAQDPFTSDTNQETSLGDTIVLADGRRFNYGLAGASNISRGKLQTAPAPKANHHNMTTAAAAIGVTQVTVTLGATAAVADEYDEGFLVVSVTPGQGQSYKVKFNPAAASSATCAVDLFDPINVALSTASKTNLVHNHMRKVVESTTQTTRACGVPLISLTAANYGWMQRTGVTPVLADGTIALGSLIGVSGSVAGAVIVNSGTYATALAITQVGQASVMAGVDTEYRPMVLNIA